MLRQIFKPKSKTSTDYLSEKHQNSIPFLTEDEEDFKFMALQSIINANNYKKKSYYF